MDLALCTLAPLHLLGSTTKKTNPKTQAQNIDSKPRKCCQTLVELAENMIGSLDNPHANWHIARNGATKWTFLQLLPGQGSLVGDMFSHGALKVSVSTLTVVIDHLSI